MIEEFKIVDIEKYNIKNNKSKIMFDLETKKNHNFFANGILVHNSATPRREDGNDMMIHGIVGDVLDVVSSKELIEKGWLTKPTITFIKDYMPKEKIALIEEKCKDGLINETPNYQSFYNGFITMNQWRNDILKILVNKHPDSKILVLTKIIDHGKALQQLVPNSQHLYGETDKKEREQMMDEFKNGNLNILISTLSIWSEGIDMKNLDVVINFGGNKGSIKTIQTLGRVLRVLDGKKTAHYYDFMDESRFFRIASLSRKRGLESEGHTVNVEFPPSEPLKIIKAKKYGAIEMEHRKTGIIKKVKYNTGKEELLYVTYRNKTHVMRMFQGLGMSVAILDKLKSQDVKNIVFKYERMNGTFEYYVASVEDYYNSDKERAYDFDKQKFLSFDELKSNMVEVEKEIKI